MPGPTPILATHRLEISYSVSSRTHRMNFLCDAQASGDSTGYSLLCSGGTLRGVSLCHPDATGKLADLLNNADSISGWQLWEKSGTIYIPVVGASVSIAGNRTEARVLASQLTYTFRDALYKLEKTVVLESTNSPPFKWTEAQASTYVKNLFTSLVTKSAGNIGFWNKSRSGEYVLVGKYVTGSLNRKIRRLRGLA